MSGGLLERVSLKKLTQTQVARYLVSGCMAVGVRIVGFYVFSIWWPSYDGAPGLDDNGRAWNNLWATVLAFLLSNQVAYLFSSRWVFEPGRHSRSVEFFMFTSLSVCGLALGAALGPMMIAWYGISHHLAVFNSLAAALVVNFVGRKFIVFKK